MPSAFHGSRISLRALRPTDAAALALIRGDPEAARYQGWRQFSESVASRLIAQMQTRRPDTPGQWYQFGIALRESPALIGDCAVHCPAADPAQAEIGFTIGRDHWGRGYGTEAVGDLVEWLMRDRAKKRIFAVLDGRNRPAQRLLAKLDFRREETLDRMVWFKDEFAPESVWAIRR